VPSGEGSGNGKDRSGNGRAGNEGSGNEGSGGSDGTPPPSPLPLLEPAPGSNGSPGSEGSNDEMLSGIGKPGRSGKPGKPGELEGLEGVGVVLGAGALAAAGGGAGLDEVLPPGDDVDALGRVEPVDGDGDVVGSFGNSEISAWGKEGFGCLCRRGAGDFDRVAVGLFVGLFVDSGRGSGRDSKGWGAEELVAEGGRDGRDEGSRPGNVGELIDDDAELVDIGSDGANAMKAGTPMSARPNVPAARDPTRRRTVVRGIFPRNLLFRMMWIDQRAVCPVTRESTLRKRTGRSRRSVSK
jgi:hypothetical protein